MVNYAGKSQEDRIAARKGKKLRSQEPAGGAMSSVQEGDITHAQSKLSEAGKDVWRQGSTIDEDGPEPPEE
jgi:hypothetical protein